MPGETDGVPGAEPLNPAERAAVLRRAVAALEADPTLLHSDEAHGIVVEWLAWSAEAVESGEWFSRRVYDNPDAAPGIKLACLLAILPKGT